jgi:RHS repeat-associated protein
MSLAKIIDLNIGRHDPEPAFYYHTDHLGSSSYLTDETGQVTQTINYLPYGETWVDIQTFNMIDYNLGVYLFNGKEKDSETGYNYFGARYYDDERISWLSVDPLSDKYPNLSPYAYCANNPVNLVDPDGMQIDDYKIYSNGKIEVTRTMDKFDRFYLVSSKDNSETLIGQFNKNEHNLIQLPSNFSYNNNDFGANFSFKVKAGNEANSFISGEAFAALLGTLSTTNTNDLTIIGFSQYNGDSPPPSKSHKGGMNGDLRYLSNDYSGNATLLGSKNLDIERQNKFNDALYKFGWKNMLSETFNPFGKKENMLLNRTTHYNKSRHHNHLHLQGFKPNLITK